LIASGENTNSLVDENIVVAAGIIPQTYYWDDILMKVRDVKVDTKGGWNSVFISSSCVPSG